MFFGGWKPKQTVQLEASGTTGLSCSGHRGQQWAGVRVERDTKKSTAENIHGQKPPKEEFWALSEDKSNNVFCDFFKLKLKPLTLADMSSFGGPVVSS